MPRLPKSLLAVVAADAAAAGLIALSIVRDGARSCRLAVAELLDGAPREIDSPDIEKTAEHLRRELQARYPGSYIRMRETGRFLCALVGTGDPLDLEHGSRLLGDRGWRLIEVSRSIRAEQEGKLAAERLGDRYAARQEG